jgi:hypothetical protein
MWKLLLEVGGIFTFQGVLYSTCLIEKRESLIRKPSGF